MRSALPQHLLASCLLARSLEVTFGLISPHESVISFCIIATHLQEGSKIDANAYIHAPTIFPLASHFTDRTSAMATRRPLGGFRMHELQPQTLWHKRDDLIKAMPTR